jgi:hypothetical protein
MTPPTTKNLMLLLPGWLMAPRRTVTAMIQAAGLAGLFHHARFHRLFAAAHWSLDKAGLFLFELILTFLPEGLTIFLVAGDIPCPAEPLWRAGQGARGGRQPASAGVAGGGLLHYVPGGHGARQVRAWYG